MCWDGSPGKSFEEARDELRKINMTSKDKELTFEDIIAQAIGAPKDLVHKAIDKMKDMPEVKETLNNIKKCQNEEI